MRRTTYKLLGLLLVIVGLIGAVLPLLPTTIFFILAAACFARSSPALEQRILDHPTFGPSVLAWRDHGVIPPKAKCFALFGMVGGYAVFYLTAHPGRWLALITGMVILACAWYVLSRPSRPQTSA